MFDRLFKNKKTEKLLIDMIEHNAEHIQTQEGKEHGEAIYLSLCLILDDLQTRPNGRKGYQQVMEIIQARYSNHFNDVITYLAWSSGKIVLKPEHDAGMKRRHQSGHI